jgi:hypothetical protein
MFVYVIRCGKFRKIGAAANVERRKMEMATGCPHPLVIEHAIPCGAAYSARAECGTHWLLAEKRRNGEWFRVSSAEAADAAQRAVAWASSGSGDFHELLGPAPADIDGRERWMLSWCAKQEAHGKFINRRFDKRQIIATDAAAAAKRKRTAEKILIARPKWHDKAFTVEQISAESGLSRRTLYNELGSRWENDRGKPHV